MAINHKIEESGYYIELYPESLADVTAPAVVEKILSILDSDLVYERDTDQSGREVVRRLRTPTLVLNDSAGLSGYSMWRFIFNVVVEVYGDANVLRKSIFTLLDALYDRYREQGFFPNYDDAHGEFDISTSVFAALFNEDTYFRNWGDETKAAISDSFEKHFWMWDLDFEHERTNRMVEGVLTYYFYDKRSQQSLDRYLRLLAHKTFNGQNGPYSYKEFYGPLTKHLLNLCLIKGINLTDFLDFTLKNVDEMYTDQYYIMLIAAHIYGNSPEVIIEFYEVYSGKKYDSSDSNAEMILRNNIEKIGGQVDLLTYRSSEYRWLIRDSGKTLSTGVHEYDWDARIWKCVG
ncbi:MAG: hypothetical protein C9355_10855 [Thalassolituus maritimus]|nr:MAG: hypothetical protein C9355_10855 [Thalassolituus maritimus]